jgi:hypothetical protein
MTTELKPLKWLQNDRGLFKPVIDNGCTKAKRKGHKGKCIDCPLPIEECPHWRFDRRCK